MKRTATVLLSIVWLLTTAGACATTSEPRVVVRTVQTPVSVTCVAGIPPAPDFPDSDAALKAAPDLFTRVKLLVAGRALRAAYILQLSAALGGCAGEAQSR